MPDDMTETDRFTKERERMVEFKILGHDGDDVGL